MSLAAFKHVAINIAPSGTSSHSNYAVFNPKDMPCFLLNLRHTFEDDLVNKKWSSTNDILSTLGSYQWSEFKRSDPINHQRRFSNNSSTRLRFGIVFVFAAAAVAQSGFVLTSGHKDLLALINLATMIQCVATEILRGADCIVAGTNVYWLAQETDADIDTALSNIANAGLTIVRTWGFNDVTTTQEYGAYYQLWTDGVATFNTGLKRNSG